MKFNGLFKRFVTNNFEATTASVKFFKAQPLESIGQLLPVSIALTSICAFVVAFITYIVQGGFLNQISALRNDFWNSLTYGTTNILVSGVVSKIIFVLLIAELIVMLLKYMKTEKMWKRITSGISLLVGVILTSVSGLFLSVIYSSYAPTENIKEKIYLMLVKLEKAELLDIAAKLKIVLIIGGAALVIFSVFMIISKYRWMIKNSIIALLISFIVLPLTLLIVENIIALVAIVIIGIIVYIILNMVVNSLGSGDDVSSGELSNKSNTVSSTQTNTRQSSKNILQFSKQGNCIYVPRNIKLYKVKGVSHDYICTDNGLSSSEICSLNDLEKGKVRIYKDEKTNMITERDIPWKH